jgi:hypothetical protein
MAELQSWMPWCHPGYSIDDSPSWLDRDWAIQHNGAVLDATMFSFTRTVAAPARMA